MDYLPREISLAIVSVLDLETMLSFRMLCRMGRELVGKITHLSLRQTANIIKKLSMLRKTCENLSKTFPNLQSIEIDINIDTDQVPHDRYLNYEENRMEFINYIRDKFSWFNHLDFNIECSTALDDPGTDLFYVCLVNYLIFVAGKRSPGYDAKGNFRVIKHRQKIREWKTGEYHLLTCFEIREKKMILSDAFPIIRDINDILYEDAFHDFANLSNSKIWDEIEELRIEHPMIHHRGTCQYKIGCGICTNEALSSFFCDICEKVRDICEKEKDKPPRKTSITVYRDRLRYQLRNTLITACENCNLVIY